MRKREAVKLTAEMVLVLSEVPEDVYQQEKLMILLSAEHELVKQYWKRIFALAEQRRPLLLECKGV